MVQCKMKKKSALKPHHKSQRMLWARNHMLYGPKWQSVIFNDEKRWNLDGADDWPSYWHNLRKEPRCSFSLRQGGVLGMLWAGFCYNGKLSLYFTSGRQTSTLEYDNTRTLE
ncbi:hypothetical protein AVEN_128993-1 [Araneus ventricosus]|uniref:Transposable element Tc3 transposase n=1 Tax=Araneus ventricosus TaxID=182803 RepID=A0A4Y2G9L2_ARAVE|nr:hypothetical protein AVEN_128993-1 [Araneus ventricosus]